MAAAVGMAPPAAAAAAGPRPVPCENLVLTDEHEALLSCAECTTPLATHGDVVSKVA